MLHSSVYVFKGVGILLGPSWASMDRFGTNTEKSNKCQNVADFTQLTIDALCLYGPHFLDPGPSKGQKPLKAQNMRSAKLCK